MCLEEKRKLQFAKKGIKFGYFVLQYWKNNLCNFNVVWKLWRDVCICLYKVKCGIICSPNSNSWFKYGGATTADLNMAAIMLSQLSAPNTMSSVLTHFKKIYFILLHFNMNFLETHQRSSVFARILRILLHQSL